MKYNTGLFSFLFKNAWSISTERKTLAYKNAWERHRVDYFDIRGVRIETGLIWDTVVVTTSKQILRFEGWSAKVAKSLSKDIVINTKDTIVSHVQGREGALAEVEAQVQKILQSNRYISQNDIRNWVSQIPDIGEDLSHPFFVLEDAAFGL